MSKSIAAPEDLYKRAAEIAAKDHVSVEEFVFGVGLQIGLPAGSMSSPVQNSSTGRSSSEHWKKSPTWSPRTTIACKRSCTNRNLKPRATSGDAPAPTRSSEF